MSDSTLGSLKEQMGNVLCTLSTLNPSEQVEAFGFIQKCLSEFGVGLPTDETKSNESKDDTSTPANSVHETDKELITDATQGRIEVKTEACEVKRSRRKQVFVCTRKNVRHVINTVNYTDNTGISTGGKRLDTTDRENKNESNRLLMNKDKEKCTSDVNHDRGSTEQRLNISNSSPQKTKSKPVKKSTLPRVDTITKSFKCPVGCSDFNNKEELFNHLNTHTKVFISCRMCRTVFSNSLRFWRHRSSGMCEYTKYKCVKCGMKFKYRRHYLKHMIGHKDNDCQYCSEHFSTYTSYKEHLEKKHSDIKIERDLIPCKFCSKNVSTHFVLYNHYRLKHSRGKFVCLSCGLFLPTKEKYKDHCLIHENEKNWKCDICEMKFYRKQQFLVHVKVHKSGRYKCCTCDRSITSLRELYQHKSYGHEVLGSEPKFKCLVCNKRFTRKFNLQNHMSLHSNEHKYICKPCHKTFRTAEFLVKHEKTKKHLKKAEVKLPESQYEKIYEDKFICETCGKQYNSKHDLTHHLRVHKENFKCDVCGFVCSLKSNLNRHKKIHNRTNEVVCELCGESFNTMALLKDHLRYKHNNIKNHKCDLCGKAFKRQSELNRHVKTHTNLRPYVCYCGQSYKLSTHLKRHQISSHSKNLQNLEEPYLEIATYCDTLLLDNTEQTSSETKDILELNTLHNVSHPNSFRLTELNMPLSSKVNYISDNYSQKEIETEVKYDSFSALDMTVLPSHHDIISQSSDSVETFNKLHNESIQLLNLSENIVHNYSHDAFFKETNKHLEDISKKNMVVLQQSPYENTRMDYLMENKGYQHEQAVEQTFLLETKDHEASYVVNHKTYQHTEQHVNNYINNHNSYHLPPGTVESDYMVDDKVMTNQQKQMLSQHML